MFGGAHLLRVPGPGGQYDPSVVLPDTRDEIYRLAVVDAGEAWGSVEPIVVGGTEDAAGVTGGWAEQIAGSIPATDSAIRIRAAIDAAARSLDVSELADVTGDAFVHGVMLGALDSEYELETDDSIEPEAFSGRDATHLLAGGDYNPRFSSLPYESAARQFLEQKPITPRAFARLDALARTRAFTVAGASRTSIVRTVQRELARQVLRGADLRDFRDRVVPRLEAAGWTPLNPSHVENVFRTNVAKTYAAGRVEHAMKPAVLRARPVWQWRGVQDGAPRQRESHRKAHGLSMRAANPEWARIYPPAGWQCRCRITAVSLKRAARLVDSILASVAPLRLVDKGFTAGVPALLAGVGDDGPGGGEGGATPVQVQVPEKLVPKPPVPKTRPAGVAPPPLDDAGVASFVQRFDAEGVRVIPGHVNKIRAASADVFGEELTPTQIKGLTSVEGQFPPGHTYDHAVLVDWGGDMKVRSMVFDERGGQVASAVRTFSRVDGKVVAHNDLFEITKSAKGKGVGKRVLASQIRNYAANGVESIELSAAWDGQYVWPRMGYQLTDPSLMTDLKSEFKKYLIRTGVVESEATRLAAVGDIGELALVESGGKRYGKDFLIARGNNEGFMLDMRLKLDPDDPGYQRAAEYLGL